MIASANCGITLAELSPSGAMKRLRPTNLLPRDCRGIARRRANSFRRLTAAVPRRDDMPEKPTA
jgi:hypothetical protein